MLVLQHEHGQCPFGAECKFIHQFLKKVEKTHLTKPRSASQDPPPKQPKGKGKGKQGGRQPSREPSKGATAKAKAKAKGKAKAQPKRGSRSQTRGRGTAVPGEEVEEEEEEAPQKPGKQPKLYCKTFLEIGSCKDPNCTALSHLTQAKVDALKVAYGEQLQGWYNPPQHKAE